MTLRELLESRKSSFCYYAGSHHETKYPKEQKPKVTAELWLIPAEILNMEVKE